MTQQTCGTQIPGAFSALEALLLGECQLAAWSSVTELDRFPALCESRLTNNPFLTDNRSGGRYEMIARIAKLRIVNGAEVRH
jgi:hypothetical protein